MSLIGATIEAGNEDLDLLGKGAKVLQTTPTAVTAALQPPMVFHPPVIQQGDFPPANIMSDNQVMQDIFGLPDGLVGANPPTNGEFRTEFDFDSFFNNFGGDDMGTAFLAPEGALM